MAHSRKHRQRPPRHRHRRTGQSRRRSGLRWLAATVVLLGLIGAVFFRGTSIPRDVAREAAREAAGRTDAGTPSPFQPETVATPADPVFEELLPDPTVPPKEQAADWIAIGNERFQNRDLRGAEIAYRAALDLRPDDEDIHYNLGIVLAAQRRFDEAIAAYQEALRLLPDYPEVHNNLANVLAATGRLKEALQHLHEALDLSPDDPTAQNNLGTVLQRLGRSEEAAVAFARAVELAPDYMEANFNLGNILFAQDRFEEATDHFERVLELRPGFEPALQALARARRSTPTVEAAP
jgi:Flp pilus assembly protein TadD